MISQFLLPYTLKYEFETILDIGPGKNSIATNFWLKHNKIVTSIDIEDYRKLDYKNHHFIKGDFLYTKINEKFDAIYASHVIEHCQDTGHFLEKTRSLLKDSGVLFIVVSPFKHEIVGGHVHVFNMGILMYNLILSHFNVKNGRFVKQGYNIVGIVKKEFKKIPKLRNDKGDIEKLCNFFPDGIQQNTNGDMISYNWFE